MSTQWDDPKLSNRSRAQSPVRDEASLAQAEDLCDRFHDLPDSLRGDVFWSLAPEFTDAEPPGKVFWSNLFFAVFALFVGAVLLGRDGHLYDAYSKGFLTAVVVVVTAENLWSFGRSVVQRIRSTRELA